MKCLIADDVPILLRATKRIAINVLGEDIEIFEAMNSDEVLDIVNEHDIDIILLDVEMPTVNGIETAKKILSEKPDIKIIIMSGESAYETEALEAGAFGFIAKPFSEEDLEQCLKGE